MRNSAHRGIRLTAAVPPPLPQTRHNRTAGATIGNCFGRAPAFTPNRSARCARCRAARTGAVGVAGAVSYVSGNLAFHNPGDAQWLPDSVNYPVATGGSFWTDSQSRAPIQIGPTIIAMDGGSELDVTDLNEEAARLVLPGGRVNLRLHQLESGRSFEID